MTADTGTKREVRLFVLLVAVFLLMNDADNRIDLPQKRQ
jgi:hypothetical protein